MMCRLCRAYSAVRFDLCGACEFRCRRHRYRRLLWAAPQAQAPAEERRRYWLRMDEIREAPLTEADVTEWVLYVLKHLSRYSWLPRIAA